LKTKRAWEKFVNTTVLGNGAQMFANRLNKNRKHLSKWLQRETITCYRLYDADMPEYAVAVDVYESIAPQHARWVHVQEYEAPKNIDPQKTQQRLNEVLQVIPPVLDVSADQVYLKVRRQQKGSAQYEKLAAQQQFHEVLEGGHRFLVNFSDYLDTGLFLDHRITRAMLSELAAGKRFLNLFAYTGSGTVYAAAGGAVATTTVDMSNTYIDWARRNMRANGFTNAQHEYIQANCLEWLDKAAGTPQYGLIFLDPPSFSTSKRMQGTFDVQRDHVTLLNKTLELLEPGGILIFSNNLRSFKLDYAALDGFAFKDISKATLPKDFERNPKIHQCWRISKS
jgi:23S rRNA (guanine2445-N2)-methyltransferase / 23S rRNA (guanine2069-N7)-methyltransferase